MQVRTSVMCLFLCLGALPACENEDKSSGDEAGDAGDPLNTDPCNGCPDFHYAVDCGFLWGAGEFYVCGIDKEQAEANCEDTFTGKVLDSPSDECSDSKPPPWEPGVHIYADASGSGDIIIEAELLDRLEAYPNDIYLDATRLGRNADGEWMISTPGELSSALGLRQFDVLYDVNGYAFDSMLDTAGLYFQLRSAEQLTLTFERDGERMVSTYVVVEE